MAQRGSGSHCKFPRVRATVLRKRELLDYHLIAFYNSSPFSLTLELKKTKTKNKELPTKLLEIDNSLTIRKQAQEYRIDEKPMSQLLQMAVSFKNKS